ncbi:hypothetical protein FHS31_002801 [Sphingomonas vulcanisoli]|uniref:Peptidase S8/S53 domain-containing protein n=1 Tax=Sphingomonas vulcanisoli TaxID=1658060 RepID=A0ABX0TY93_9SPHN|nr:S8 family peptidase [Sphingomonas vulcanisoli]NIJ09169.1 hypothetical protein [Sphingomonas vulcanisoli]
MIRRGCGLLTGASLLMLTACGGGGGGVNSVSSAASTGSTTTTTPAAPVINYNDAEYQRSNGTVDSGAITAWNAGYTGTGQTLAIIDSGIKDVDGEFTGRILSSSTSFNGTNSISDEGGHGTTVAGVAAAARNGSQMEGVAFNANLMILRTDTSGSCGGTDGCSYSSTAITNAINYATTNGAKVINMSLGGSAMPSSTIAAVNRATAAGIIVVISAGNDGSANPDVFADVASLSSAHGLVIIAGSHDANGTISSFSDRAGTYAQYYLTALGNSVRTIDNTGAAVLASGTSYSAPEIAAAALLLEQAFPNLTPTQVVALLYSSATDAGATGVDSIYGNGLLNIAKAFAPVGSTSLAGSTVTLSSSDTMTLSSAMGDAKVTGSSVGQAVVLDALGRAYTMSVAPGVAHVAVDQPLRESLAGNIRSTDFTTGRFSVSSMVSQDASGQPWQSLALGRRGFDAGIAARPVSSTMVAAIGETLTLAAGYASSGHTLEQRIDPDAPATSFLAARAPDETPGFTGRQAFSLAGRQSVGHWAIGFTAERGTINQASHLDPVDPAYAMMGVRAERRFGGLTLIGTASTLQEDGTVLGARLSPAMGRSGAVTRYLGAEARLWIGKGWSLAAHWRQGWTHTQSGGVLLASDIKSRSASFDLAHVGAESRFGLRVALPPRVTAGGLDLWLPTSYDYTTGAIGFSNARIGLAPQGQERDVEANFGTRIPGAGWLDANVFLRMQPGNIAAAGNDVGSAVRYSVSF